MHPFDQDIVSTPIEGSTDLNTEISGDRSINGLAIMTATSPPPMGIQHPQTLTDLFFPAKHSMLWTLWLRLVTHVPGRYEHTVRCYR